jgi:type IV pilus assembly protein PilA
VILVIGILAAIAIPSFLNQQEKAVDASAKELGHSAQVAAETYATDNNGSWAGMTPASLRSIEATIPIDGSGGAAYVASISTANGSGYSFTIADPRSNETFTVTRLHGQITRTCTPGNGLQGGCVNGTW